MGPRLPLLLACALLLAGCSSTPVGTQEDRTERFSLGPKGTVSSATTLEFDVLLRGDLTVRAHAEPGPVLVVLQEKKDCGAFAEQGFIPGSRYELADVDFTYFVPDGGTYCLTFQNRNAGPIDVEVTVSFP